MSEYDALREANESLRRNCDMWVVACLILSLLVITLAAIIIKGN